MLKITDIFNVKPMTFSVEIFPPKTDRGMDALRVTLGELSVLQPDFVSVTYGAGGSSRDTTFDIVQLVEEQYHLPAVHHFTCVAHTRDEIRSILDRLRAHDIRSILALRGDAPKEQPQWAPGPENFKYASDLVQFIRDNYGDHFAIGVAGFPEGHPLASDIAFDARILAKKVNAGGEFVMTQLFFDNQLYFDYVRRLRTQGVAVRVIPGILPITNYEATVNFCRSCGAAIPPSVHEIFAAVAHDKDQTLEAGTLFAIRQCRELLAGGAPGIHLYSLNKTEPVRTILQALI